MLGSDALRLTAGLIHTLPTVTAVLRLDAGPDVVVGSDRRCLPDLSACALRRLVGEHRLGGGPDLTWLSSVVSVELGGPDVIEVDEDVVAVGGRDEPVLGFATLLDSVATRSLMRDVGARLHEEGRVDLDVLRQVRASTFHDEVVSTTTVVVAPLAGAEAETREVVMAASRACRVAELVESVTAAR